MKKLLTLLLFPLAAFAQTPVESLRNIVTSTAAFTVTVAPLDVNGIPIAALAQPAVFGLLDSSITVTFPVSATQYTLTGIQVTASATGQGFKTLQPIVLTMTQPPILVPVGSKVSEAYSMPLANQGSLLAVVIAPPPPPPPPVVVPPPAPAPPPPAPTGNSPDGTFITAPTGTLTTAEGTWTWNPANTVSTWGTAVMLNGKQASNGYGAKMYVLNGGKLFHVNLQGKWYMWSGGATGGWVLQLKAPI